MALRWNHVLGGGEILLLTTWTIDGNQIAVLTTTPAVIIKDDRFAVNKSEVATLIFKNVSVSEDVTIQCAVQTNKGTWKYKIRVEITGERKLNFFFLDCYPGCHSLAF